MLVLEICETNIFDQLTCLQNLTFRCYKPNYVQAQVEGVVIHQKLDLISNNNIYNFSTICDKYSYV